MARPRAAWILLAPALLPLAGCRLLVANDPLPPGPRQSRALPTASLRGKEEGYRAALAAFHDTPEGVVDYRVPVVPPVEEGAPPVRAARRDSHPAYGKHADVCFFTGIALGAEVLRFAATGTEEARAAVLHRLEGLEALEEVTGVPGLLARHLSPWDGVGEPTRFGPAWRRGGGRFRDGYVYRGDVSKDQYAGFAFGIGTLLAHVEDPELRRRAGRLAGAVAERVLSHGLRIVDADGEETTYGDLSARILGYPVGVNALIALAVVKAAAEGTGEERFRGAYAALVRDGLPEIAAHAHFEVLSIAKATNDHMAFLALYPLLHLEESPPVRRDYRRAAAALWGEVGDEENSFYAFAYASAGLGGDEAERAVAEGLRSLRLFPGRKIPLPVDLTDLEEFGRRFLNAPDGTPRSARPIPMHLRPVKSHMWSRPADRLVGNAREKGDVLYAGIDYLVAYWMGRFHGFVDETD